MAIFLGPTRDPGKRCRFDLDNDVRARLRERVQSRKDLSINVLELLSMVETAWAFVMQEDTWPSYARDIV